MKIPNSIRSLYSTQIESNERLLALVNKRFNSSKKKHWHYESRLKSEESFAVKIESGRFDNPGGVEDFFACTLVVSNGLEIDEAIKLVNDNFTIHESRPEDPNWTYKSPEAFPFDDLRIYAKWKDDPSQRPTNLTDIVFEIQIKTFLQHAWTIATHDLIYKADDVDWSKQRIAFQIKAMLEHAELSIQEAGKISESTLIAKNNNKFQSLNQTLEIIKMFWDDDRLPANKIGLAQNVHTILNGLKIDVEKLKSILESEGLKDRGAKIQNLSPYGVIVQSLIYCELAAFKKLLKKLPRNRIIITPEIKFPSEIDKNKCTNAIFI
jgi:ppGpp synthetase/RelA/SpoT-type nucleotidyltranferase